MPSPWLPPSSCPISPLSYSSELKSSISAGSFFAAPPPRFIGAKPVWPPSRKAQGGSIQPEKLLD